MDEDHQEIRSLLEKLLEDKVTARNCCIHENNSGQIWYNSSQEFVEEAEYNFPKYFAIFLALLGILANLLSLTAMLHISGAFTCNLKLVFNLLLSDVFISLTLLCFVWKDYMFPFFPLGNEYGRKMCEHMIMKAFVMMGHCIALLNLVVLAFDHFMAINKPLKYIQVMTNRRVYFGLLGVWVVAGLSGFSDILLPAPYYSYCKGKPMANFCEVGYCSSYETEYLLFIVVFLGLLAMVYFYSRVFMKIYKYQNMSGRHQRQMKRNIKGLITTLIILGTFLACWLPHVIFESYFVLMILAENAAATHHYHILLNVNYYLYWLWLINSISDPVIYAVRMREVKKGYQRMFRCNAIMGVRKKRCWKKEGSFTIQRRSATSQGYDFTEATWNITYSTWNSSFL